MSIFDSYGVPNTGPRFAVISLVMVSLAILFVILRVAGRFTRSSSSVGWDDLFVILALACCIIATVIGCEAVSHGFGRHGADLSIADIHEAMKYFYAYQVVYKFLIMFTKLSFLVLYLRLFPNKTLRMFTWVMIWFIVLASVASGIVTVVQCVPITKAWNKNVAGGCVNNTIFWYTHAAFNTLTDIIIYIMPIPQILQLQLPSSQKWGLVLIFATGAFVLFTSIMRMIALSASSKATDPTWGSMPALTWTEVEANTGVIVACLPSLRAPIMDIFNKLMPRLRIPESNIYGMKSIGSKHSSQPSTGRDIWDIERAKPGMVFLDGDVARRDSHERITKTTDITVDFASIRSRDLGSVVTS